MYLHRDVCAILDDIQKCYNTRNFSPLPGLLAEARILVSRVEAQDDLDYEDFLRRTVRAQSEYRDITKKVREARREAKEAGINTGGEGCSPCPEP